MRTKITRWDNREDKACTACGGTGNQIRTWKNDWIIDKCHTCKGRGTVLAVPDAKKQR